LFGLILGDEGAGAVDDDASCTGKALASRWRVPPQVAAGEHTVHENDGLTPPRSR
jgi:hypothetical protein